MKQTITLEDLRSDPALLNLFRNNFGGNSSIFGVNDQHDGPSQTLDDWYNSLGNTINFGVRSGDKQGTQYNYVRQPDGSFKFQDTSTYYRPSSWVNFRDEVGIPTALAAAAMTGLSAAGASGAFGANVAQGVASQGGVWGMGAPAAATAAAPASGAVTSPVAAGSATLTNLPAAGSAAAAQSGAAAAGGGLLSTVTDFITKNPLQAGLLTATAAKALSEQNNKPEQDNYIPRNLGGSFAPQARAQYQPLPDRSGLTLNTQPGAQGSGLWRFMR